MSDNALEEIADLYELRRGEASAKLKRAAARNIKRAQERGVRRAHSIFAIERTARANRKSKPKISLAGPQP
jgi:hypothetical protein